MSPEEQRLAIAEACGVSNRFVLKKRGLYYRPNAHGYTYNIHEAWMLPEYEVDQHCQGGDEPVEKYPAPLPDYLNDLNAMHEAEEALTLGQRESFAHALAKVIFLRDGKGTPPKFLSAVDLAEDFALAHATAAQRAEAFLKTVRRWKEYL